MIDKLKGRDAAFFISGYVAALIQKSQRIPKYIDTAFREAADILEGGSFRGPLAIMEMEDVAEKLRKSAATKCRVQGEVVK